MSPYTSPSVPRVRTQCTSTMPGTFEVGSGAVEKLVSQHYTAQVTPVSFVVMVGTLIVNLGVTFCERRAARRLKSATIKFKTRTTQRTRSTCRPWAFFAVMAVMGTSYTKREPLGSLSLFWSLHRRPVLLE